jgi:hypothetical protein
LFPPDRLIGVSSAQLAQVNVALLRFPLDSPHVAEFIAAVDGINALADQAPGFIWRYSGDTAGPFALVDPTGDPLGILNVSVWQTYQDLHDFTYRSRHMHYLRRRTNWFVKIESPSTALWWTGPDRHPTVDEAVARLDHLRRYGPTPRAFTVRSRFEPTGRPARRRSTNPSAGGA